MAALAVAFAKGTGRSASEVLFSGQLVFPTLVLHASGWTIGACALLVACKSLVYALSLSSFAVVRSSHQMFIGAAAGIAASHLPGMEPGSRCRDGNRCIGHCDAEPLLTGTLLATLLLFSDGIAVIPLVFSDCGGGPLPLRCHRSDAPIRRLAEARTGDVIGSQGEQRILAIAHVGCELKRIGELALKSGWLQRPRMIHRRVVQGSTITPGTPRGPLRGRLGEAIPVRAPNAQDDLAPARAKFASVGCDSVT